MRRGAKPEYLIVTVCWGRNSEPAPAVSVRFAPKDAATLRRLLARGGKLTLAKIKGQKRGGRQ